MGDVASAAASTVTSHTRIDTDVQLRSAMTRRWTVIVSLCQSSCAVGSLSMTEEERMHPVLLPMQDLVDDIPRVLLEASIGGGWWLSPDAPATAASARQAMEGAADGLMSAHAAMARLDFRSPEAVRDTLRDLEVQLALVADSRELVEKRVREIQALLVEQYKRGDADPEDWVR
jgi:hypothetical protein